MTSLLVLDPRALEGQILSLLRKRSDRRYTANEILDILAEKKLLKRSKRPLVLEALARISCRGVQRKRAIRRALNDRSEVVYYYHKPSYKSPVCYLCGEANQGWALLGGLYKDSAALDSMCEALPRAICETCYRVCFSGVRRCDLVATGTAVLPFVSSMHSDSVQDLTLDEESKEECAAFVMRLRRTCDALDCFGAMEVNIAALYSDLFQSFGDIHFARDVISLQRAFSLASIFTCYEYREASVQTTAAIFYLSSLADLVEEATCVDESSITKLLDALIFMMSSRIRLSRQLIKVWTGVFGLLDSDDTAVVNACRNLARKAASNEDAFTRPEFGKRLDCSLSSRKLSRGNVFEEWALGQVTAGEYDGTNVSLYSVRPKFDGQDSWDKLNEECKKLLDLEDHKYLAKFLGTIQGEDSIEFVWQSVDLHVPLHTFCQDSSSSHHVSGAEIPVALQICSALEALHFHNPPIVHGDLSSSTVFISQDCHVKLGNYGVSSMFQGSHSLSTVVCWVAPEIILSKVDTAFSKDSDLYAYGMVVWYLYSRRAPYKNMHSAEALYSVAVEGLRPDMKDLPIVLAGLVNWCLDVDPRARPRLDEIQAYLQDALPR